MFNLFRRQREAEETEPSEKRLDDDNDVTNLVRSDSTLSVDSANRKRVTWAKEMEQVQLLHIDNHSDSSSQVSSSEDEEEERNCADGGSDEDSEQGSGHDDSDSDDNHDGESDDEDDNDEEETEEAHQSTKQETDESKDSKQLQTLRKEMDHLSKDLTAKTTLIDRLQFELREAHEEAELSKYKMSNLHLELEETKQNLEMAGSNQSETESDDEAERAAREEKLKEAETRISQLEEQLKQVRAEKEEIEVALQQLNSDRDTRLDELQRAYEEALREQDEMMAKFEEDFEELRTVNSRREQQLLDDFEWKLREVEKNCKARLEKRDNEKERRIADLIAKLSDSSQQLQEAKRAEEVCKLEVDQAHTTNTELQRNLRTTTRRLEQVQVNEKVLQEEANRLRTQFDKEKSFVASLQVVHREELDERERKSNFRLDAQKNLLNSEWEDRLKQETRQLKQDMERNAREETDSAVQLVRKQMDRTIVTLRAEHGIRTKHLESQIEELKKRLSEEEEDRKEALESAQSSSDSQLLELRRKMEKLYMSYEEKIEKLNEQHEQQISRIHEESEKRIQQIESNMTMQSGSTRATIDLVKEQLNKEHQTRLQQLETQHQRQLEDERNRMKRDKEEALKAQEAKHREVVKKIQLGLINHQNVSKDSMDPTDDVNGSLAMPVQTPVQNSTRELTEAEAGLHREKERLADLTLKAEMCRTIQQLTLQLEASKKEIETLNSRLNSRGGNGPPTVSEAIRPLAKEPPAPPPRTRGRHHATPDTTIPTAKVQPQNYVQQSQDKNQPAQKENMKSQSSPSGSAEAQADGQGVRIQPGQQSRRSRKNRSKRH